MQRKVFIIIILLIICYFPIFLHLDALSLFPYDESRLAINAWEMLESGNLLVTTFEGKPDMWNTKPPLMIWFQVLCMKLFGVNELSVRLPSSLAALTTIILVGVFCWKYLEHSILGIFTILVLVTTPGYITTHVSRTGDYDALLILFSTLFLLTCFKIAFASKDTERTKLLLVSSLSLSLAVLTKSIAGLLFTPIVVIYFLYQKSWFTLLKSKYFYLSTGFFLLVIGAYYFMHELSTPGYIQAVWDNEVGGRYLEVIENHGPPFNFYFNNIYNRKFIPWIFFLPLTFLVYKFQKEKSKNFLKFSTFSIVGFLLIVSSSKSKLEWYDAPIYPFLSIIIAIGIGHVYKAFKNSIPLSSNLVFPIFCIAIFGIPYKNIISSVYLPSHQHPMNMYADFIKEFPEHKNYSISDIGYNAQIKFYSKLYNEKGYKLSEKNFRNLKKSENVLICGSNIQDSINLLYEYDIIENWKECKMVKISKKNKIKTSSNKVQNVDSR